MPQKVLVDENDFLELHNALSEIKTIVLDIKKLKSDPLSDPIIDIDQLAKILKISKRAIYTLRMEGKIEYIQQPGSSRIYFRASSVNAYLDKYQHKAFHNPGKSF